MYSTCYGHQRTKQTQQEPRKISGLGQHSSWVLDMLAENDIPSAFQVNTTFYYIYSAFCPLFIVVSVALSLLQIPDSQGKLSHPPYRAEVITGIILFSHHIQILEIPRSCKISEALKFYIITLSVVSGMGISACLGTQLLKQIQTWSPLHFVSIIQIMFTYLF